MSVQTSVSCATLLLLARLLREMVKASDMNVAKWHTVEEPDNPLHPVQEEHFARGYSCGLGTAANELESLIKAAGG